VGQQARTYQTWTIVGFLLLHHILRVKTDDVDMLDINAP
jgi:beta-fructofuranosidase